MRRVYLLDPQKLRPETIAVAFAKTSRVPQSFDEIAAELTEEKSAQFHEKWVVGYGHASVAEHAVLHIAVEGISRLAVETLESNRLASYTEKSTRYQKWSGGAFHFPAELEGHPLETLYRQTCDLLFDTYQQSLESVRTLIARQNPPAPGESEAAHEARIRTDYVDVCRFLLPAASLANVGVTINARALEYAVSKMLSHPLAEVRALGEEMRQVALEEVPTLVKYAAPQPYIQNTRLALEHAAASIPVQASPDWCRLVAYDPQTEEHLLAASLYRHGNMGYAQALEHIRALSPAAHRSLANLLLADLQKHDSPLRELEHASFTFDLTLDQGAYFELKRHRMMTQSPQPLSALLGYATPARIVEAGFEAPFRHAMQAAEQAFHALAKVNPHLASYIVPNAFNRRLLLTLNLRSAIHFLRLRAAPNAHFSIRRVAYRMAEELHHAFPLLGAFLPLPSEETWQEIERVHFSTVK